MPNKCRILIRKRYIQFGVCNPTVRHIQPNSMSTANIPFPLHKRTTGVPHLRDGRSTHVRQTFHTCATGCKEYCDCLYHTAGESRKAQV